MIHVLAWVIKGICHHGQPSEGDREVGVSGCKPSGNTDVPYGIISQNSPDTQCRTHAFTRFEAGTCAGERTNFGDGIAQ